jgi:hypothetical protein
MLGRPKGGISIYTKPAHLPVNTFFKHENIIAIETKYINIICCYFQPHTAPCDIVDAISECTHKTPSKNKPTMLVGDFNIRIDQNNSRTETFLEYTTQLGYTLESRADIKTYICHNGSSTIDLIFLKDYAPQVSVDYANLNLYNGITKHQPMAFQLHLAEPTNIQNKKSQVKSIHLTSFNTNVSQIVSTLQERSEDNPIEFTVSEINNLFYQHAITNNKKIRSNIFFDQECKNLRRIMIHTLILMRQDISWSNIYNYYRKVYHSLIKEKKRSYDQRNEERRVERAEKEPYRYLKQGPTPNIPIAASFEDVHAFLKYTFTKENTTIEVQHNNAMECGLGTCTPESCTLNMEITTYETQQAIRKLKLNKAPGPDGISNNAIKQASASLIPLYTALFNRILNYGTLPSQWKASNMKLVYKGKGDRADPAGYRTLCMENTQMKLLASIVNTRIAQYIDNKLPDEQYGFRKNRSTTDAIDKLLHHINLARNANKPLYTVFVDFSQAFNLTNRTQALSKMYTRFDIHGKILKFMLEYLKENTLQVDINGKQTHVMQNIGTPQGDCLSSTNFIIDTSDLFDELRETGVDIGGYADDIAIYHREVEPIRKALSTLQSWCRNNGMIVNVAKTKIMKFRRCGPIRKTDIFLYNDMTLEICNTFTYLGLTFQTSGITFTTHIEKRLTQLYLEMHKLGDLYTLSLQTALQLFYMKLSPIMEYAICSIWPNLTTKQLIKIDTCLTTYLKHICRVSKCTRNRVVLMICDTPTYINVLKHKYDLQMTDAYTQYIEGLNEKLLNVDPELFHVPAMVQNRWKECMQTDRHIVTRHAAHGFHHHICARTDYHEADEQCRCQMCGQHAPQYHILHCPLRTQPLRHYATVEETQ